MGGPTPMHAAAKNTRLDLGVSFHTKEYFMENNNGEISIRTCIFLLQIVKANFDLISKFF